MNKMFINKFAKTVIRKITENVMFLGDNSYFTHATNSLIDDSKSAKRMLKMIPNVPRWPNIGTVQNIITT